MKKSGQEFPCIVYLESINIKQSIKSYLLFGAVAIVILSGKRYNYSAAGNKSIGVNGHIIVK